MAKATRASRKLSAKLTEKELTEVAGGVTVFAGGVRIQPVMGRGVVAAQPPREHQVRAGFPERSVFETPPGRLRAPAPALETPERAIGSARNAIDVAVTRFGGHHTARDIETLRNHLNSVQEHINAMAESSAHGTGAHANDVLADAQAVKHEIVGLMERLGDSQAARAVTDHGEVQTSHHADELMRQLASHQGRVKSLEQNLRNLEEVDRLGRVIDQKTKELALLKGKFFQNNKRAALAKEIAKLQEQQGRFIDAMGATARIPKAVLKGMIKDLSNHQAAEAELARLGKQRDSLATEEASRAVSRLENALRMHGLLGMQIEMARASDAVRRLGGGEEAARVAARFNELWAGHSDVGTLQSVTEKMRMESNRLRAMQFDELAGNEVRVDDLRSSYSESRQTLEQEIIDTNRRLEATRALLASSAGKVERADLGKNIRDDELLLNLMLLPMQDRMAAVGRDLEELSKQFAVAMQRVEPARRAAQEEEGRRDGQRAVGRTRSMLEALQSATEESEAGQAVVAAQAALAEAGAPDADREAAIEKLTDRIRELTPHAYDGTDKIAAATLHQLQVALEHLHGEGEKEGEAVLHAAAKNIVSAVQRQEKGLDFALVAANQAHQTVSAATTHGNLSSAEASAHLETLQTALGAIDNAHHVLSPKERAARGAEVDAARKKIMALMTTGPLLQAGVDASLGYGVYQRFENLRDPAKNPQKSLRDLQRQATDLLRSIDMQHPEILALVRNRALYESMPSNEALREIQRQEAEIQERPHGAALLRFYENVFMFATSSSAT